jgi:hypothetical protein
LADILAQKLPGEVQALHKMGYSRWGIVSSNASWPSGNHSGRGGFAITAKNDRPVLAIGHDFQFAFYRRHFLENGTAKIPAVSKISIHDQQLNGTENAAGVLGTQNEEICGLNSRQKTVKPSPSPSLNPAASLP